MSEEAIFWDRKKWIINALENLKFKSDFALSGTLFKKKTRGISRNWKVRRLVELGKLSNNRF